MSENELTIEERKVLKAAAHKLMKEKREPGLLSDAGYSTIHVTKTGYGWLKEKLANIRTTIHDAAEQARPKELPDITDEKTKEAIKHFINEAKNSDSK